MTSRTRHQRQPILLTCVRSVLWALIVVSFMAFFFALFIRPTAWFSQNKGGHFGKLQGGLTVPWHALVKQTKNVTAPVFAGTNLSMVVLLAGSTLLAALCALTLKSLPQSQSRSNSPIQELRVKVKAGLNMELPPHSLWEKFCGGLSVLDALLVAFWLCLVLTWVWGELAPKLPTIRARAMTPGGRVASLSILDNTAQAFGWAATWNILLLFYPIPRNSFLHYIFGTDFPGLVKYHRWLGTGAVTLVSLHLILYFSLWWHTSTWREEVFDWPDRGVNNAAGIIAWCCGMAMLLSSLSWVRRRCYSVFYTFHIGGFVGFMLFAFIHYQYMWTYTYPGFALYLLDATFRIAQRMHVTPADASSKASEDGTLSTLTFRWSHVTDILPSQIMWINIPSISILHWHPVSVAHVQLDDSRNPEGTGTVTVHYKAYGAWTKALVKELQSGQLPLVRANGPFGCVKGRKWGGHEVMVIFAGGIGITPMLGMLRHMAAHARSIRNDPSHDIEIPEKVYLVWSARSKAELALLDQELIDIAREDEAWLDIKLHCTSKGVTPSRSDTAMALDQIPHLPGAAPDSPNALDKGVEKSPAPGAVAKKTNGVKLSDLSYDDKGCLRGKSSASAFFMQPGGLVPYGFGNLHWAAAYVVASLGAFLAGVLCYSYSAEKNSTSATGMKVWLLGIILYAATCIMTMGLAAAVILPMHFWRHIRDKKRVQKQNINGLPSASSSSFGDAAQNVKMSQLEAQNNVEVSNARPDLESTLKQTMKVHSDCTRISVFVAGPEAMFTRAKQTCALINSKAAGKPVPVLAVYRQAYTL